MKCGELGFRNKAGAPCEQDVSSDSKGCMFHTSTKEELSEFGKKAIKGFLDQKLRKLPLSYPRPLFNSYANIISFTQDMARLALTGNVDLQRINVALKASSVARETVATAIQEKLYNAIMKLEHGAAAVSFLTKLSEGTTSKSLSEVIGSKNGSTVETNGDAVPIVIEAGQIESEKEAEAAIALAEAQLEMMLQGSQNQKPRKAGRPKKSEEVDIPLHILQMLNSREEETTPEAQVSLPKEPLPTDPKPSVGKITSDEIVTD